MKRWDFLSYHFESILAWKAFQRLLSHWELVGDFIEACWFRSCRWRNLSWVLYFHRRGCFSLSFLAFHFRCHLENCGFSHPLIKDCINKLLDLINKSVSMLTSFFFFKFIILSLLSSISVCLFDFWNGSQDQKLSDSSVSSSILDEF